MNDLDIQTEYWDSVAASRTFTHPLPWPVFRTLVPPAATILDYGCGYGRTCSELSASGYQNVIGIDISKEMIQRGKRLDNRLDLRVFDGRSTGFRDASFDVCLLLAVLTCIPCDDGLNHTMTEVLRLLRPGGILFISDYPLQADARNQERYQAFEKAFGIFGIFRTGSAVVRHFEMRRIYQLLSGADILFEDRIRVCTMNGNASDGFQLAARKQSGGGPCRPGASNKAAAR